MTWWETSDGDAGQVSMAGLFDGERPVANMNAGLELEEVIENILRPGFPAMTALEPDQSADRLRAYVDEVARTDIRRLADVRHKPDVIKQLIAGLARSVASDVTYKTLAADVRAVAPTVNVETISHYVGLLQPKLRSRARLRTSPKLHLVDAALAAASLGAGLTQLRSDLATLGVLFESAVIHDLMVLASGIDGEVRHYRDSNGKEIDAIVTLPDGRWGAVEVKLGGPQMLAGVESLRDVIEQIDTDAVGEPAFRLVVTGTGPILTADDDTVISPLSALAP